MRPKLNLVLRGKRSHDVIASHLIMHRFRSMWPLTDELTKESAIVEMFYKSLSAATEVLKTYYS